MIDKQFMHDKFDNLNDLNLTANLLTLQGLFKKWCELRPDNEELIKGRDAIVNLSLLVNSLQLDRQNYHIALSEYKARSTRSIERARRAEDGIKALEEEVSIYRKKEQLGL